MVAAEVIKIVLLMALSVLIPLLAVATPITIVLGIVRIRAGGRRRPPAADRDEARVMQEIHHGLTKMEQRIDALETILLERERRAEYAERL